jgi:hypothetical protein
MRDIAFNGFRRTLGFPDKDAVHPHALLKVDPIDVMTLGDHVDNMPLGSDRLGKVFDEGRNSATMIRWKIARNQDDVPGMGVR